MIRTSGPQPSTNGDQPKAVYIAPVLEYLGKWQALTLQQSVPVEIFQRLKL
jgi:hypothetical protein